MAETTQRLMPIEAAGKQFGVPYRTLRKRVIDKTLPTYQSDRDRRVTFVDVDDIAALFTPRLTTEAQEVEPLSAA